VSGCAISPGQLSTSSDAGQRQLGDRHRLRRLNIGTAVARQNPTLAPVLKAADTAYASQSGSRMPPAARDLRRGIHPRRLLASIKQADSTVRHRGFSRGTALMQISPLRRRMSSATATPTAGRRAHRSDEIYRLWRRGAAMAAPIAPF